MKIARYSTLTILIFAMLASILNGFVQETAAQVVEIPDPIVKSDLCRALDLANNPDYSVKVDCTITRQDMEELTQLDIVARIDDAYAGNTIKSITGIEYAINLTQFQLHRTYVSDLSPISGLTKLTTLWLVGNFIPGGPVSNIEDISPLAGLVNLEELRLDSNSISDLTPISGLTKLTDLHIGDNPLTDISPIAGLTNLKHLYIANYFGNNPVTDISPIAGLTSLTSLNLIGNQITDISALAGLTNLERLDLADNEITDISALAGLTNLKGWLVLRNNNISDVSPLIGLTNLEKLWISGNPIQDITPLLTLLERNPGIQIYLESRYKLFDENTEYVPPDIEDPQRPTTLEIVSGDNMPSAPINQPLTDLFVVKVKDENDNPITDVSVDFSVNPNDGQLTPESDMTDENGEAQTQLTLGSTVGTYTVTASVPGTSQSVSFTVTAARPTTLEIVSGDNQGADVNQPLTNPLVVKVKDENDNVVSGVTVNFSVNPSSGQLSPASDITDANGEAQTILTLGSAVRTYYVTASVPGISESVMFIAYIEPIQTSDFSLKHKIVVSEIMFETKGEPDKYPQWIELYNNDNTEVNLNGWEILLLTSSISIEYDLIIKPKNTLLIASPGARFSDNIQYLHTDDVSIIDMSNLSGFLIELLDSEDRKIDFVNTYDEDDYTTWDMPNGIVPHENDARTSIIRRFSEGEPVDGYKRIAWIRAYNTKGAKASEFWYGHSTDIGTPGYRSSDDPLPVELSLFTAKFQDNKVIMKWATESELDNAGFNIYRSSTRNGQFRQINAKLIQGAGTTGERSEYTWTDTTAKPNTVYYYQIEDVSHAGVREQLATIHMKGFITAKNKLTTQWATLKNQR